MKCMETLLETRIDLKEAENKQSATTMWEKLGYMLVGAGIMGLVSD